MRVPGVCQDCRQPVHWNGFRWINASPKGAAWKRHVCLAKCGAFMPRVDDRCGRKAHHAGYHRSRYAMDNERRARGLAA